MLRYVGGDQGLEVASDAPAGQAAFVLFLAYLVTMNVRGIGWARADRAWLAAHPDAQAPADRQRTGAATT